MKKLLMTLALLLLCATPAAAATIQNEGYPGGLQEQAEMLKALGLFRGTEQGFELGRAMTRDEAAAMLVRYLGAEDTVLAGDWKHPFSDVPAWADKYVGWLYQSGLTKGVSKTRYGAAQPVTCDQFCIFLNRAATGDDSYAYNIAQPEEVAACDKAGFTRGDAALLSARTLSAYYTKNGNTMSMAQFLIGKGVFTAEGLKAAAWDVLPRVYGLAQDPNDPYGDWRPACRIADVVVARNDALPALDIAYDEGNACNNVYAVSRDDGDAPSPLYALDPQTLNATELYRIEPLEDRYAYVYPAGAVRQTDYLLTGDGKLLEVAGKAVQCTYDAYSVYYPQKDQNYFRGDGCVLVWTDNGILLADAAGVRTLEASPGERVCAVLGDRVITQAASDKETVLRCRDASTGETLDTYTVPNDYILLEGQDAGMREVFAPQLLRHNSVYFWGDAGLYKLQDGRLRQITARATIDYGFDPSDGSHVILTHEPGKRVEYPAKTGMAYNPAADEIARIRADGTEELLLRDTPAHGLTLYKLARAAGGEVRALNWNWVLEYAVEGGKIRVLPPSGTWDPGQYRDAIASEQKRLDALGAGVGG